MSYNKGDLIVASKNVDCGDKYKEVFEDSIPLKILNVNLSIKYPIHCEDERTGVKYNFKKNEVKPFNNSITEISKNYCI